MGVEFDPTKAAASKLDLPKIEPKIEPKKKDDQVASSESAPKADKGGAASALDKAEDKAGKVEGKKLGSLDQTLTAVNASLSQVFASVKDALSGGPAKKDIEDSAKAPSAVASDVKAPKLVDDKKETKGQDNVAVIKPDEKKGTADELTKKQTEVPKGPDAILAAKNKEAQTAPKTDSTPQLG